ncbi:TMEM43 family protein, partial [bacterium]|nr:TMEM43 family protein [bacterium]
KKKSEKRKKFGGGEETVTTYTYEKKWVRELVDSSKFKESGHDNVVARKYQSGASQARTVTLGAFQLSDGLISQMSWDEPYSLQKLPDGWTEKEGSLSEGVFFTGKPGSPQIGDEKVSFALTRPDDVSVMGVQTGNSFTAFESEVGKTKLLLYQGLLSAEEVVAGEEQKAKILRWALRGGGVLIMFFGLLLILKPLSVLADVLPFLGSLVGGVSALIAFLLSIAISFVVIAISWIFFRPLLGIGLLAVAIVCLVAIKKKMSSKNRMPTSVPPPLN